MRRHADRPGQRESRADQVLRGRDRVHPVRPGNGLSLHLGARRATADRLHGRHVRHLRVPAGADPALRLPLATDRAGFGVTMATVPFPIAVKSSAPTLKSGALEYLTTKKDELVGWARKFSLFPYPFVTACCAMEFMAVSSTPYDTDRFGAALPRFSPRQSDLLMVVGTITHKQAPILLKVYEQMCEPKWVMAFGACATSGGFYQNYAAVAGIDLIVPVDVYIPGCPPRPETVIDGIMQLQDLIARSKHPILTR